MGDTMNMLTYAPPLITFLAIFIGLLGPSRRQDKTGLRAITPFGWIAFGIAIASLCVATYSQHLKNTELEAAQASQRALRTVMFIELKAGIKSLEDVLRYAALMPYTSNSTLARKAPNEVPYAKYLKSRRASDIDLRSPEVIQSLERLYLSPTATISHPYLPWSVPFGIDARPCMTIIAVESAVAKNHIETVIVKYAAVGLPPETLAAASELVMSRFLTHLINLPQSWANRAKMEDSETPTSLHFLFLNSGLSGSSTGDYLELLNRIARLSSSISAQSTPGSAAAAQK